MTSNSERGEDAASGGTRAETVKAWWDGLSGNARGSIWFLGSAVLFAVMASLIKSVGQRLPVVEILFFRQLFVVVLISPVIAREFPTIFNSNHRHLHAARVLCSIVAMTTGFTAIVHMPIAEVTTISFARSLFTTILAVIILREVVGIRRWSATAVGFIGVMIVLQPSGEGIDSYAILAVISAFFVAFIMILTRIISQHDRPATIMSYQSIALTLLLAGPAWYFWVEPTWFELALMVSLGGLMSMVQYTTIQSFKNGEAVALAPMEYSRLLFVSVIGYFVFSEVPTVWTWVGAAIIAASTIYTMHRNAEKKSRASGPGEDA